MALVPLPEGYELERLHRSDIAELVRLLGTWYPDISVGVGSVYLDPGFYESRVALRDEEDNDIVVWVLSSPKVAAAATS